MLEYGGYMLSGDKCKSKCLFLVGQAGTAKSTFGDIIKMLVPTDSYSGVKAEKFNNENYVSMMHNKLFNIADETHPKAFVQAGEDFKTIVTGGEITARQKYKDAYKFKNKTKVLLTGNELPYNYDSSNAIYSRLIIVGFDKVFRDTESENENIVEEMIDERAAILKLFADSYAGVKKHFTIPKISLDRLKDYKESNDSISVWLDNCFEFEEDGEVIINEAISHYKRFCESQHLQALNKQKAAFSKLIGTKFNLESDRKRVMGVKCTYYRGLKLKGNYESNNSI
jgi:P4 family phage/plasmid primase-like protien